MSILCFVGARGHPVSGKVQYPLEPFSVGVGSFFNWPIIQLTWPRVVNTASQRNLPERVAYTLLARGSVMAAVDTMIGLWNCYQRQRNIY